MSDVVIDTNVIVVANFGCPNAGQECLEACLERLEVVKLKEKIAIDDQNWIVREYIGRVCTSGKAKTPGSVFLKWLLHNAYNEKYCVRIKLKPLGHGLFAENPAGFVGFDLDDMKFLAVANSRSPKATVLQATDTKWSSWTAQLSVAGINVEQLCLAYVSAVLSSRAGHT